MNLYELLPTKELKRLKEDKTYITENLINSFHIIMPSTFGDYAVNELNFELRVYLPTVNSNGTTEYTEYMGYPLTVENDEADVPITNDITEAVQIVKIMILATKEGNVIGKTNFVNKQIYDAPLKGEPLTPRKDFDEVIEQQRETIEEQGQTITKQQGTITEQGEQITELSGEVSELTAENQEQAATITRQNTTIDELNRRVPPLETLDPINPTTEQVTYNPESPNIGFPQVIVNAPTAERLGFREDYYKKDKIFLNKVGTYDPFPEHSVGGIYITEVDEDGYPVKFLVKNYERTQNPFSQFFDKSTAAVRALEEIVFENCPNILTLPQNWGSELTYLKKLILPLNCTRLEYSAFLNCTSLTTVHIGKNTAFRYNSFQGCSNLEFVTIENGYNVDVPTYSVGGLFNVSTKYSVETIVGWLNALADRTGETAYTFCMGTTNLNKLTAEQIAIATNKNWNLA